MDTDDEELKETKKKFEVLYVDLYDVSLYDKELQEKRLIRELKIILHDGQCKPNWRETINDTIKLLEGE